MELTAIGKITRLHGFKGEVVAKLNLNDPGFVKQIEFVFFQIGSSNIPHKIIRSSHKKADIFRFQFEGVNSEDVARSLVGKEVQVPSGIADSVASDQFRWSRLEGYLVIDIKEGKLGTVSEVINTKTNPTLVIVQSYNEILVPYNEHIVDRVDDTQKEIYVECPEGLIDLYR